MSHTCSQMTDGGELFRTHQIITSQCQCPVSFFKRCDIFFCFCPALGQSSNHPVKAFRQVTNLAGTGRHDYRGQGSVGNRCRRLVKLAHRFDNITVQEIDTESSQDQPINNDIEKDQPLGTLNSLLKSLQAEADLQQAIGVIVNP